MPPHEKPGYVGLYAKYDSLPKTIERLEPAAIAQLYKEYKSPCTFFPNIGLFFNEFALVYASTLNVTKKT